MDSSPDGAPAPPVDELPIFGEAVEVNVVNVDVYVTDRDGKPVTGLTAADFELFEDGRRVEITNFHVVEDGRRVDPSGSPPEPEGTDASPPVAAPIADAAVPEEDRLHLVVYIDNFDLRPLERNRVLDEVMSFLLRTMRREDRVMLASFDRSFKVHHPFTGDPFAIEEKLGELRETVGHVTQRDGMRREAIKDIDRARTTQQALSTARIYSDMVFNELGFMFDGLRELIDHLAGLPGRKAVLHVSSGIPMVVGEDLFYAIERKFDDSSAMSWAPHYDLSRRFAEVGQRANANRVSFYTIDAGGLRPHGAGVDEQGLRTLGLASSLSSDYEANHHSPLRYLAEETGGRAIVNQNNILPALYQVRDALRTYYSLGFRRASGDETYHRIEVKVARKDLRVAHRTGYRDKTVDTKMREGTLAALYHFHHENPLGLEVDLVEAVPREASTFLVGLKVQVPVARMTLLPNGESRDARLRLYLAVMDGEGKVSAVERVPLGLRLREEHVEAALAERFVHVHRLVTRGGRQKIAIGLRDELSGDTTFLARSFLVGADG